MSDKQQSNLEYNDGLGDMLREKKTSGANLNRSILIASSIVAVSVVAFALAFKWGTDLLFSTAQKPIVVTHQTSREREIAQENKALIKEMEALLARASADVSHPTATLNSVPRAPEMKPPVSSAPKASGVARTAPAHGVKLSGKSQVLSVNKIPNPAQVHPSNNKASKALYRVMSGPYTSRLDANVVSGKIQAAGYGAYVKAESNGFFVQAGAYSTPETSAAVVSQLSRRGISASVVSPQ